MEIIFNLILRVPRFYFAPGPENIRAGPAGTRGLLVFTWAPGLHGLVRPGAAVRGHVRRPRAPVGIGSRPAPLVQGQGEWRAQLWRFHRCVDRRQQMWFLEISSQI